MIRRYCILVALLACCACSAPGSVAPTASSDADSSKLGLEAHAVLGKLPATGQPQGPSLKLRYPDKATFLADVQTTHPNQAVALDGSAVWAGFGPALQYRTSEDGSIAATPNSAYGQPSATPTSRPTP